MDTKNSSIRILGSLHPDEPMWRYMGLSNLLMLFQRRVFIPSIETLRRCDPTEATYQHRSHWEHRAHALPAADVEWISLRATGDEEEKCKDRNQRPDLFWKIWDREMAQRRCAWSWYGAEIESMAQWHVYAKDGVAILSTPARIQRAFADHIGLIGRVEYERPGMHETLLSHRPYFVKKACYRHEQEVRLVLPVTPLGDEHGVKIDVDPKVLIERIEVSPLLTNDIVQELRECLERFVNRTEGDECEKESKIHIRVSDANFAGRYYLANHLDHFLHTRIKPSVPPYVELDSLPPIMKDDILK